MPASEAKVAGHWRSGVQSSPHSRWLLTALLTELPWPRNVCNRLLPQRGGQSLTLPQKAAHLCTAQTCSRLLMKRLLLPPLTSTQGSAAAGTACSHKMQLYSVSQSKHCSRRSRTVLKRLCSGELLGMTGSAGLASCDLQDCPAPN